MLQSSRDFVSRPQYDIVPFEEVDESTELQELLKQTLPEEQRCSVVEYVNGEEEIPVCFDNGDDWDANFQLL